VVHDSKRFSLLFVTILAGASSSTARGRAADEVRTSLGGAELLFSWSAGALQGVTPTGVDDITIELHY